MEPFKNIFFSPAINKKAIVFSSKTNHKSVSECSSNVPVRIHRLAFVEMIFIEIKPMISHIRNASIDHGDDF